MEHKNHVWNHQPEWLWCSKFQWFAYVCMRLKREDWNRKPLETKPWILGEFNKSDLDFEDSLNKDGDVKEQTHHTIICKYSVIWFWMSNDMNVALCIQSGDCKQPKKDFDQQTDSIISIMKVEPKQMKVSSLEWKATRQLPKIHCWAEWSECWLG